METRKTRIAFVSQYYGGTVTSVDDLVIGFDRNQYDVMFIYLGKKNESDNHLARLGFKTVYLSNASAPRFFNPLVIWRLAKVLKENHIDILHCHAHKATTYGAMAAALSRTPFVCAHVHGLNRSRTFRRKLMNFILFKRIDLLLPVAEAVRQDVIQGNWRLCQDKVVVLENSIDYGKFANVPTSRAQAGAMLRIDPDAFIFGTVGRLAPTKGLGFMLEAFAAVRKSVPNARLAIVGRGPIEAELKKQARNMQVADFVDFVGYRADIEHVIRGFDIFVMSSVAEGMPRVILEAMAAGVPCIATNVGGIPDIFEGGDVGLLVPPSDSAALAGAMNKVAGMSAAERETMTANAGRRVREVYSHDVVREKLRRLYDELLMRKDVGTKARESGVG